MKKTGHLLLFVSVSVFLLIIFASSGVQAQEPSCITQKCHTGLTKVKYLHGPVEQGECAECHGTSKKHASNPKRYKFKTIDDISSKCYSCHDPFEKRKFTHSPVEDGECLACHNPHGSNYKFQLNAKGGDLCFTCHDSDLVSKKFVHGPAAVGGCVACHEPHTANYAKNLRAKGSNLCFMCHEDKAETIKNAAFVHKPVAENCANCHNPHSAPKKFFLEASAPDLCLNCHKKKREQLKTVKVKHGALEKDRTCLNCHDPHNSQIAKNLIKEPMDLCLSCHDREYQRKKGRPVPNMKKWLAENKDHHGPIRQKDCSGCHNPHGSENFRILRYYYPPTFYKPFDIENYQLCFSCHEKTIALKQFTTKLTNFRNGNENLHFKHVNKPVKGRTCRACHETHASNFPKHIRESVPFGAWALPVNYEKTETGGSCTPGCHKLKRYDRVQKVVNE
jgi:DmsE family decaheme c-type cytochrome